MTSVAIAVGRPALRRLALSFLALGHLAPGFLGLGFLGLGWAGPAIAEPPAIEVGQPFPDIAFRTQDGQTKRVADFRGTKKILHVFASW